MGMIQLPKQFHPDFAVPGKKPVGPVEIDWSNPITKGLIVLDVLDSKAFINYAHRNNGSEPGTSSTTDPVGIESLLGGRYIAFHPSGGSSGVEYVRYAGASPDNSSDLTICSLTRLVSAGFSQWRFGWRTNDGTSDSFKMEMTSSSNFRLQYVDSSPAGTNTNATLSLTQNDIVFAAGTKQGSTIQAHISANGGPMVSSTPATGGNGTFRTGSNIQYPQYGSAGHVDGGYIFAWDRALSVAEIESIRLDPYQLLKPVNAPVYFPAAAAGGGGITGTADFTLAGLTTTSSGDVDISGISDITLDVLTTTSAGSVDVEVTADITFDGLTVVGQGSVGIEGTSDITFDTLTTTGQGFVGNPPAIGTADFTLAALTTTSLGTVDVSGTSDNTFDALTTTTAGSVDVEGTSSNTFDGLSLSSSGSVAVEGTYSNTFADLTLTGQGTTATIALGTADFTFDGLTVTSVGDVAVEGTSSANLNSLTTTTNATVSITGTSGNTLDALTVTASASGLSLPRIDGLFNQVINTDGGSVRMYFNGTDYFTL